MRNWAYLLTAALAYIGFGFAWILLSDALLAQLLDTAQMQRISTAKGLFFVLLTAAYWSLVVQQSRHQEPTPQARHWLPPAGAIAIALLLPLAALMARQQIAPLVDAHQQMLLIMVLPITLTALLGGLGPGLLATAVSALAGVLRPDLSGLVSEPSVFDRLNLLLLIANGLLVSLLSHGMHRALRRKRQSLQVLAEREQQLRRVLEGSQQGYWGWDPQAQRLQVSGNLAPLLGLDAAPDSLPGWEALLHAEDLSALRSLLAEPPSEPRAGARQIELRFRHVQGGWKRLLVRGGVVDRAADGGAPALSGTFSDVTERRELELALREAQLVFDRSDEGIMVADAKLRIVRVNPAFCAITGYSPEEVLGHTPKLLSSGRHDRGFYAAMWTTLSQKGRWRGEIWNQRKNGEIYPEMLSINTVRDALTGAVQHYVAVFTDISLLKQHADEMQRMLHFDPLTGAPNRRLLTDRLQQASARSQRSGRAMAVCLLDLDGFRHVNENHGEDLGNRLLVAVAERLQLLLRADDTLARLGGDEFVLLLTELGSGDEALQLLDRVLLQLSRPFELDGLQLQIGASIGVSLYPEDPGDADTLLRHADQAMVQAKEAGRQRYQLYDPAAERRAQAQRELLDELRVALAQNEFRLYYQPKVALADGRLIGVEALIRWQHPQRGLVPPAQFLPQIAGTAFEHELGEWVICQAWRQAAAWHAQWGGEGKALSMGINLSAPQLLAPGFIERLRERMRKHPELPPDCIELEVLESAAIHDLEQATAVMSQGRALGLRFALDDFGTGYSSLTYLRRLPVDTLKIDQSFVFHMLGSDDDRGIVAGVIGLARGFGLQAVAEGVETLEHARALRALGCEAAQGYGIGRPMPAEALPAWRASWKGLES